jgi:hypoxanthine phosphoribosyltransferase
MNEITIVDKQFELYITHEKIMTYVEALADRLNASLRGQDVFFIGILNGAFIFASDLLKLVDLKCRITFVKLASYEGTMSSGKVKRIIGIHEDIKDQTVVVIEDIVDTGITLDHIIRQLRGYEPKEIKIATMFHKPEAYQMDMKLDYVGMEIPDRFVVGYGLDYEGYGRNFQDLYILKET